MILPVNALSPKVAVRGNVSGNSSPKDKAARNIALINATGISTVIGAVTTVAARSYTSGWGHAGLFGAGATLLSMMFIGPRFLYKAGFNTSKTDKLENYSKALLRKTA